MQSSDEAPYHHGNLRAALIAAADAIIAEKGIEGFSLREAARRAGVSPGAPAHHFGTAVGLLTEVALLGYANLGAALNAVPITDDPAADLRAQALAYVGFALAHAGRFRLMFRPDLVNRNDPRYGAAATAALAGFAGTIGRSSGGQGDGMAQVFVVWSSIHGMANLALDGKAQYLFDGATTQQFAAQILPDLLAKSWPYGR
jgi:AcrR family transcriptional regulator